MLNIKEKESKNIVEVTGILNEMEVNTGTSKKTGKDYVSATIKVRLDQEINGVATENLIPVKFFAMKKKNDGTDNKAYQRILDFEKNFISATASENGAAGASRIKVTGAKIAENAYVRQDGSLAEKNFVINGSFINKQRDGDVEGATFELSGVVGKLLPEVGADGEETGRLLVDFVVIGYKGIANVIRMVATDAAKAHIENNWQPGDTVNVNGIINMYSATRVTYEEQGFGKPLERKTTEYRQELVIVGGSQCGLEEAYSYDASDVKVACDERVAYLATLGDTKKEIAPAKDKPKFQF